MGHLWSIQGLPSTTPHGMVETPHGGDFSSFQVARVELHATANSQDKAARCLTWLSMVCTGPDIDVNY